MPISTEDSFSSPSPTPASSSAALSGTPEAQQRCVADINALLAEASEQWQELQDAIEELRAELAPEELSEALTVAGLTALKEAIAPAEAAARRPTGHAREDSTAKAARGGGRSARGRARSRVGPTAPTARSEAKSGPPTARSKAKGASAATGTRAEPASPRKVPPTPRKCPAVTAPKDALSDATTPPENSPAIAPPRRAIDTTPATPPQKDPSGDADLGEPQATRAATEEAIASPQQAARKSPAEGEDSTRRVDATAAAAASLEAPSTPPEQSADTDAPAAPSVPTDESGLVPEDTPQKTAKPARKQKPTRRSWLRPRKKSSVDKKLEEVLELLRGAMREEPDAALPTNLSDQIAREVAGRLKETVAESLRENGTAAPADGPSAPQPEPKKTRIPLGDVQAIIDQLTQAQ